MKRSSILARFLVRLRRDTLRVATVIAVVSGSVVFWTPAANAVTCGSFGHKWVGWGTELYPGSQPNSILRGAKAIITDRNTYDLCTNPNGDGHANFVTSYVMIYSDDGQGWAR